MIVWNRELYHSWGTKPKQKAREKQYNAWYYQKYKWRWLDNAAKKERKIIKKLSDKAEEKLKKAKADEAKLKSDVMSTPLPKHYNPNENGAAVTKEKAKDKSKKKIDASKKKSSSGSSGGSGKKKGSGGSRGSGGSGKKKSAKKPAKKKTVSTKPKKKEQIKQEQYEEVRRVPVYGPHGELLDTQIVRTIHTKKDKIRISSPKPANKKTRTLKKARKRLKKIKKKNVDRGRDKVMKLINNKEKNRRS